MAQEILEDCEGSGYGGWAPIGPKGVWKVAVKGFRHPDRPGGEVGDYEVGAVTAMEQQDTMFSTNSTVAEY